MTKPNATIHPWNEERWKTLTQGEDRSTHALLFCGPTGLAKFELAFALAQHVVVGGHQQSQNLLDAGTHPDLHVLMPEDYAILLNEDGREFKFASRYLEPNSGKPKRALSIEQIRKLNASLTTHPHISKHRVILISHADTLNRNAANGLLKSLEEPPANTLFILVTDGLSRLPKTIRSRCSLISFKPPSFSVAKAWLEEEGSLPAHDIDSHLAMANNQPLHALKLFNEGYVSALKVVFSDVNALWSQKRNTVDAAKNWHLAGSKLSVEILQKLCADLLRAKLSEKPAAVFFPVQQTWVQSSAAKLSNKTLLQTIDALVQARRLLSTTVDELLVMETVSSQIRAMPE